MALRPYEALLAGNQEQDRIDTKRAEKAKAYREYVDAKVSAGETVDPLELDRVRHTMASGDPYLASYIPSGAALKEMANRANERSAVTRMEMSATSATAQNTEQKALQQLVDTNWDKDPEYFAKSFSDMFGPEAGAKTYDRYKEQLPGMLTEATQKKVADLAQSPAMAMVQSEEELASVFAGYMRNPRQAELVKTAFRKHQRDARKQDTKDVLEFVKGVPIELQQTAEFQDLVANGIGYESSAAAPASQRDLIADITDLSRTGNQVAEYKKKVAALQASVMTTAESYKEKSEELAKAVANAHFSDRKFRVKTSKGMEVDPRITSAFSYARQSGGFFPSEENFKDLATYIAGSFLSDPKNFTPTTVVENYLAGGTYDNQAQWVDRRVESLVTEQFGIPPETHVSNWVMEAEEDINEGAAAITESIKNGLPEEVIRADIFQLKQYVLKTKRLIEAAHRDPARRLTLTGFDYPSAMRQLDDVGNKIVQLETQLQASKPAPQPATPVDNMAVTNPTAVQYGIQQGDTRGQVLYKKATGMIGDAASQGLQSLTPSIFGTGTNVGRSAGEKAFDYLNEVDPRYAPSTPTTTPGSIPDVMHGEGGQSEIRGSAAGDMLQQREEADNFGSLLNKIAYVESGNNPNARASTSSATGLFQFTRRTWNDIVNKYGASHGITHDDIESPEAQRIMMSYLTRDNMVGLLNSTGKVPTEADIYLAHFLGVGSAAKLINNIGTQQLAANMFPAAAQANRALFYKDGVPVTIEQLYQTMSRKMTRAAKEVYRYDETGNPV